MQLTSDFKQNKDFEKNSIDSTQDIFNWSNTIIQGYRRVIVPKLDNIEKNP